MKIRNGFVSNSSSSSFIIASKVELNEEKLMEIFQIPENSPLHCVSSSIAECIMNNSEKYSYEDLLANYSYTREDLSESFDGLFETAEKDGYIYLYEGSFSNDSSYGIEYTLVDLDFKYRDDQFIFWKDGGY